MSDWLVKLYDLPAESPTAADATTRVRKPLGAEHTLLVDWVSTAFGPAWASELAVALANRPVSAFLAQRGAEVVGFACYDATARGLFGPIGVADDARGLGIGARLLSAALNDMRSAGYCYAVVGGVGPGEFFQRVAGAVEIPGSSPGPYAGMLRR